MVSRDRVRHRVAQFLHTLLAPLEPVDVAYARARLSPALFRLFRRMSEAEQHHGIAVCRALEAQGYHDPDLLAAALLHDVGKALHAPALWDRVAAVLGEHYAPTLAEALSQGPPEGLRRGFVVRRRHPRWGASLAEAAGASPRTVSLILHHHDPPGDDAELAALQAADEAMP